MDLDGYDNALLVFQCFFLLVCCIGCYGIEVLSWIIRLSELNLHHSTSIEIEATTTNTKQGQATTSGLTGSGRDVATTRASSEEADVPGQRGERLQFLPWLPSILSKFSPIQRVKRLHLVSWVTPIFWMLLIIPTFLQAYNGSAGPLGTTLLGADTSLGEDKLEINPDIGGVGVRAGLYITVGLAMFLLLIGHFHKEESGAKEIGTAQFLSRFRCTL